MVSAGQKKIHGGGTYWREVSHKKAVVEDVPEVNVTVRTARDKQRRLLAVNPCSQEDQLVH